ncbi:hypothetical protein EDC01DRAFT_753417 [Geopyxis carbonaria]|nr:hypothetical protein EDC01DRAFT_753417 [Geopyxis carbonaria]
MHASITLRYTHYITTIMAFMSRLTLCANCACRCDKPTWAPYATDVPNDEEKCLAAVLREKNMHIADPIRLPPIGDLGFKGLTEQVHCPIPGREILCFTPPADYLKHTRIPDEWFCYAQAFIHWYHQRLQRDFAEAMCAVEDEEYPRIDPNIHSVDAVAQVLLNAASYMQMYHPIEYFHATEGWFRVWNMIHVFTTHNTKRSMRIHLRRTMMTPVGTWLERRGYPLANYSIP